MINNIHQGMGGFVKKNVNIACYNIILRNACNLVLIKNGQPIWQIKD